jgi:hypothetical protein
LPSAAELAARVELQRKLAEAVLALSEPTRSTLVLRYLEGLAPRHIARRQGVPPATVKSRLKRGLSELRARLDRDHGGDGRSWLAALAPLLRAPTRAPLFPLSIGVLAVNAKLLVTSGALAAALALFLWTPAHAGHAPAGAGSRSRAGPRARRSRARARAAR